MVNTWLERAGYRLCRGEVMAGNPQWCTSLKVWKKYFHAWISGAEPLELRKFSIFFDFRPLCGSADLAHELRTYIHEVIRAHPAFLVHFAESSLQFRPPVLVFGRIIGGTGPADSAGRLDLKETMMPLVSFARVYSLSSGGGETHTLDRLEAMGAREILHPSSLSELESSYDLIMRMRLRHQLECAREGRSHENSISLHKPGAMEEMMLKQYFAHIGALQRRVCHDFPGGR